LTRNALIYTTLEILLSFLLLQLTSPLTHLEGLVNALHRVEKHKLNKHNQRKNNNRVISSSMHYQEALLSNGIN